VKAQVKAMNRLQGVIKENGMVGGVQIVKTCEDVLEVAKKMCGQHLVTYDTPKKGLIIRGVIV
jgi:succinyl-CoA synthetase beta subunit